MRRAQFLPAVNYSVGASDGKNEFLGPIAPGSKTTKGAFLAVGSVAWEADIWGRIRRLNESARAQYFATAEARRGVMLTLTSEVAQAYFQLLGLELQLQIAKETTASFDDTLKLFQQRYECGVASKLDTSRAEAAQAASAAFIPEYERQIALQENVISVLLGSNPQPVNHTAKLLDEIVPPDIPVGLPSALLERCPDVLAAEQQVRAANAQVGLLGFHLGDDGVKPDLPLLHQEVNLDQVSFGSAPRGFEEETGEAEVACMRNVAAIVALPVHPHIPCGWETHRSSPTENRARRQTH